MNEEYYGAPGEAGAYGDSPSSSSQGYGSTVSESSPQTYFESYRGDSSYPNFLKSYGHSKTDELPLQEAGKGDPEKEPIEATRRRILVDMDTETLRTLLSLVRLDYGASAGAEHDTVLEDAIISELGDREGEGTAHVSNSFVIDWNERFQALLAESDSLEKFAQLRNLANDFCFTAELYARIIISELYLPTSQKTIKPSSVGGVAGGQKFVVQGILFKFAVDVELRKSSSASSSSQPTGIEPGSSTFASGTPTTKRSQASSLSPGSPGPASSATPPLPASSNPGSLWMYGGAMPSTEFAMKAAKHELRSTIAYFSTSTCRVPLVALVDFRGYRVLCSSLLPIDRTTICYGSSDAGRTIHADADAALLFEYAGEKLNLKKHKFKGKELCAPVDIEGHHGHDGNMYCVDLARLFPPEAPPLALQSHPRAIYFRMLRPELVRAFPNPLSSDAFTNFGASDELCTEHNSEVEQATKHLQSVVLPQFAKWMCTSSSTVNSFSSLVYHMHRRGINLRYLGLLRSTIEVPENTGIGASSADGSGGGGRVERVYIPVVAQSHLSLHRSLEGSESSVTLSDTQNGEEKLVRSSAEDIASSPTPLRSTRAVAAFSRPYANETVVRQLLLEEMIARVLKCMLRAQWRRRMQEVRICTETPFAVAALDLVNIVACKSGSLSKLFWTSQIKTELVAKFQVGLTARELHPEFDLTSCIELRSLLERFTNLVGVLMALNNEALTQAKRPFLYTDLLGITSTIHHMNIIDFAEGRLLALTARKRDKQLKLQLLAMAEKKLTAAHSSGTHISLSVVFELANVHYQQAMLLSLNQSSSNVVEAIRCYISALALTTPSTPSYIVGKCHIRLLRLYFEKIGSNILLQEQSLQSQGIPELSLSTHLNIAAALRPRALRKLIQAISQLNVAEPSSALRSAYLPDCSKTTSFGVLVTCLSHSEPQARDLAREIFDSMTALNFQFCPQLLDPVNSGWRIGTQNGVWTWKQLERLDFTACLTATPQLISLLLEKCPKLKHLVLNQCQSIDDSLATSVAHYKIETLEISFCHITDAFFDALAEHTYPMHSLLTLNLMACAQITDDALKTIAAHANGNLTSIALDSCPRLQDIRPLKKLKKLTSLSLSDSKVPEPRLRDVLKQIMPKLLALDLGCTSVTNDTFEFISSSSGDDTTITEYDLENLSLRKTRVTRDAFCKFGFAFPKLRVLNITANDFGHGFGKHVKFEKLERFECGLDKYTSGVDSALVSLKTVSAPLQQLNVRSGTNTVTDAVLLMSVRAFPALVSLNISVCAFLSNAAMEAVSNLNQLQFLSLSGNRQLVDSALVRIAKSLGGTLTGLEIAHCKQLTTAALEQTCKFCTELRYLDVSFVESFKKIQMVGTYCLKLESFKSVGLNTCAPESFQRFFSRGVSLRRLNFKSCPITNDAVLECAYSSRFLTEICLSDCSAVDDVGITRLLQLCRYLHRLEITSVSVSDMSFEAGKKSLSSLRYLVVSGCQKLTDKTLRVLKNQSPLLEFLNCSGCPLLTESAFLELLNAAKYLLSTSISFCPRIQEDTVLQAITAKGGTLVR